MTIYAVAMPSRVCAFIALLIVLIIVLRHGPLSLLVGRVLADRPRALDYQVGGDRRRSRVQCKNI